MFSLGFGMRLTRERLVSCGARGPQRTPNSPAEPDGQQEVRSESPCRPRSTKDADSTSGTDAMAGPAEGRSAASLHGQPPTPQPPHLLWFQPEAAGNQEPWETLGGRREKASPHRRGDRAEPPGTTREKDRYVSTSTMPPTGTILGPGLQTGQQAQTAGGLDQS